MRYPRFPVVVLLALIGFACATRPMADHQAFVLQPGDLLFQDLDGSPLCDAIEKVTQGVDGAKFSHVAMVERIEEGKVTVIEAVSAGVVETPIEKLLKRSHDAAGRPKVLVGRLQPKYRPLIPRALEAAHEFLGRPYDATYVIDNSAFYCSELIYEAFREANGGRPLFALAPMTFNDPDTKKPFPAWVDYFRSLGTPLPEGQPGLNPGGMSRAGFVRIVHAYGKPTGWRGHIP